MSLEDLTGPNKYIANLVPANPPATDPAEQGCDHIQGIKNVLQNSFPGMNGPNSFQGNVSASGFLYGKGPFSWGQGGNGQVFTNATFETLVNFVNVSQSSDAPFNPTTGVFTVPRTGNYLITSWISSGYNAAKSINLKYMRNGAAINQAVAYSYDMSTGETYLTLSASTWARFAANDLITAQLFFQWSDGGNHERQDGSSTFALVYISD